MDINTRLTETVSCETGAKLHCVYTYENYIHKKKKKTK